MFGVGDNRAADPDHLEVLADKLWAQGDSGAYGDLTGILDRARNLNASGELSSLQPLLEWLMDAAEQLREGARILRGERESTYGVAPSDLVGGYSGDEDGVWDWEVMNKSDADRIVFLADQDEISAEELSELRSLLDSSDESPDFAAYLIGSMGVDEFLDLSLRIDRAAADMDGEAQSDAVALQTSLGNVLAAAFWVPGDLSPGTDAYRNWIASTPQGQNHQLRLDAFNLAGKQWSMIPEEESAVGFDVALDLLERAEISMDTQFFMQTMTHLTEPFPTGGDWDVA